jgi:hypothetical protein
MRRATNSIFPEEHAAPSEGARTPPPDQCQTYTRPSHYTTLESASRFFAPRPREAPTPAGAASISEVAKTPVLIRGRRCVMRHAHESHVAA